MTQPSLLAGDDEDTMAWTSEVTVKTVQEPVAEEMLSVSVAVV